jgi:RNA polymerase sigma factor (sigma-70 family)
VATVSASQALVMTKFKTVRAGISVGITFKAPLRRSAESKGTRRTDRGPPAEMRKAPHLLAEIARRDALVLENLPLAKTIAMGVYAHLPVRLDLDDLVQAGVLGLIDAAKKFNSEMKVVFPAYAKHRIKGAMLDSLRKLDWASRDMRRRHKQVEAATRDLASVLQRSPTEAEVAEKLGMGMERFHMMMVDLRSTGLISASTRPPRERRIPRSGFSWQS